MAAAHAVDISMPEMPAAALRRGVVAAPANRTVQLFVTRRDDTGKVQTRSSVRIESDDSPDSGVGPGGAKMSLPSKESEVVRVLFPAATAA